LDAEYETTPYYFTYTNQVIGAILSRRSVWVLLSTFTTQCPNHFLACHWRSSIVQG